MAYFMTRWGVELLTGWELGFEESSGPWELVGMEASSIFGTLTSKCKELAQYAKKHVILVSVNYKYR